MTPPKPTKRSKKGCLACLQSKVKCSETHPICNRCTRTGKQCLWPGARPSLRAIRRGNGPYKDRSHRNARPIVPADQEPEQSTEYAERDRDLADADRLEMSDINDMQVMDKFINSYTSSPPISGDSDFMVALRADMSATSQLYDNLQQTMLSEYMPPSLQAGHIPSASSIILGRSEYEALHFFKRVFAKVYSPKAFEWSPFAIMADYGNQYGTIQHLIIAAAMGQLNVVSGGRELFRLGKSHFQSGAQLVIRDMHQSELDHSKIFIAFWLLQVTYNTYWGDKAAASLAKLSQAMTYYVRKYRLLDLFTRSSSSSHSEEASRIGYQEQSLIGRLMIYTLYEDIDAEFCHAGGSFATELCSDIPAITQVYFASKDSMSHYFKEAYPHDELIDDVQRSNILELHFEANLTLNMINKASRNPSCQTFEAIAKRIQDLKLRYFSTFQLTEMANDGSNRVLSCANNVVAHFLAVEIYNLQYLQTVTTETIYSTQLHLTIKQLLHTIGNLCREYPMDMPYRNQWLFFIAGIGTSDPIHVAWITEKLKQGRYFNALKKTMNVQALLKMEMTIDDIRSLFWGTGDEPWNVNGVGRLEPNI